MSNTKKVITKSEIKTGTDLIEGLTTKSSQIRKLNSEGWKTADISRFLTEFHGKLVRYQHVRNVLITPLTNKK